MNRAWWVALALCSVASAQAATVCRMVTVGSMAFGNYDLLSAIPTDSLLNIVVACDRSGGPQNITVEVALGAGANGASVSARRMVRSGGVDTLNYGLYRDIARSSDWGNSSGIDTVTRTVAVPNNGSASLSFTVYARIPAGQDVPAGNYGDSVQITVRP